MLENILKIVRRAGYENIIITEKAIFSEKDAIYISDVRSAVFFALGKAKKGLGKTTLLIDERFISSAYTALMELWFQRIPVLLILYNGNQTANLDYLRRCVDNIIYIDSREMSEFPLRENANIEGPVILRVAEHPDLEANYDYSDILDSLSKIQYPYKVFVYNSPCIDTGLDVSYITDNHKYGMLSKYTGYITPEESRAILCIPENAMDLDSNIFNSRFISGNFKIIVLADSGHIWNKMKEWIRANDIEVLEVTRQSVDFVQEEFLNDRKPTVLYVK